MIGPEGKPRPTEKLEVLEVDAQGRPRLALRIDLKTGEKGEVAFVEGYRQPAGATHVYDPFDGLKGEEDRQ